MLSNCTRCGKVFQKISGRKICPLCQEADEAAFTVVNQYVSDHPGAEVAEVSEKTGVEEALVLRFLRDGRFAAWGSHLTGSCTQCGKNVPSGQKLCEKCRDSLARELFPEKPRPHLSGGAPSDAGSSFRAKHRFDE